MSIASESQASYKQAGLSQILCKHGRGHYIGSADSAHMQYLATQPWHMQNKQHFEEHMQQNWVGILCNPGNGMGVQGCVCHGMQTELLALSINSNACMYINKAAPNVHLMHNLGSRLQICAIVWQPVLAQ
jgi:hypothetical protein